MTIQSIGPRVVCKPQGEYDSSKSYVVLDMVKMNNQNFIAKKNVPVHVAPTQGSDNDYWAFWGDFDEQLAEYHDSVAQYLEVAVRNYETVQDMKADDKLDEFMFASTSGYYSAGDGGGALYVIQTSSDEWCIETLDSGKVAKLISTDWHGKMFGLKADGVTDETALFSKIIRSYTDYGKSLILDGGIIKVNETITLDEPIRIVGNGATVFSNIVAPVVDFRSSPDIAITDLSFDSYGYVVNVSDPKEDADRNIFLKSVRNTASTGEPINFEMFLQAKRPDSYANDSGGEYARYPLAINNFSGYNALMIVNENVLPDGTLTGAADNSAIGILDRVTGVAPAAMIINTRRSALQVINENATYKSSSIEDAVMCIGADGHIAIGCSNLNDDNEFAGNYDLKIYKNIPIIAMKSADTGNRVAFLLNNDASGTVGLYVYNASDNVQYETFKIQKGKVLLKVTEIAANQYNTGLKLTRQDDATKFKNLVVDSDRFLRCANYDSLSVPSDAPVVQTSVSGATADRPTLTNHAGDVGFMYFDTTLGKPVWWIGNNWVDATGATA